MKYSDLDEFIAPVIGAFAGVVIFMFGFHCGHKWRLCDLREPRAGDVYVDYQDKRSDNYALTNGFPSECVVITKIIRIVDDTAYSATWTKDISRLEGYGSDFNLWGPVSNYVKYPKYYTLVKP